MAKNDEKAMMVRMRDSILTFVHKEQDIRGYKVIDRNHEEIGKVKELFLDPSEENICFLEISSGGLLGPRKERREVI